jgi:hypothetical protein
MLPWVKALEEKNRIIVGSSDPPSNKKKNRQHKDVIYPIFLECAALEDNLEWKGLFNDIAYDILPKGFSVRNKTLAYTDNYKTTPIRMDLEASALHQQLVSVFETKKGLNKHNKNVVIASVIPASWKEIKKRINRKNYILRFVSRKGQSYGWSVDKIDAAISLVSDWMEAGYIKQTDVILTEGEVTNVADINITQEEVTLNNNAKKKIKMPITKIHTSRLYYKLRRVPKKKQVDDDEDEVASESTAS